ncbi:MAG: PAS domain-containing protein [Xanthobacteraceae bacterium]|nr:PAS domain-containing protein [Xanthobacteraceae bacterium]
MKHPSNREFFAYWDDMRADEAAPDRSNFAPEGVRHLLGDIFVLSYDPAAGYPFRVAGTRTCALLGGDMKGHSFTSLFGGDSRREIEDIIGIVAEETLATIAGITAATSDGEVAHLELLLLPFSNRAHTPLSLTGLLAPFEDQRGALHDLTLTSWRHIGHERMRGPRALRKWSIVRGLTVYEGLR